MDKEATGLSRVQQFSRLCVARPYQISVNYIFKHIHTTSINTIIWQFVPFIYHLCEKDYFLMSNLHCSLTNAALCPELGQITKKLYELQLHFIFNLNFSHNYSHNFPNQLQLHCFNFNYNYIRRNQIYSAFVNYVFVRVLLNFNILYTIDKQM